MAPRSLSPPDGGDGDMGISLVSRYAVILKRSRNRDRDIAGIVDLGIRPQHRTASARGGHPGNRYNKNLHLRSTVPMQSRRNFISHVATGLAGTLAASNVLGANDRVRVGIIGLGDRGREI